MRSETDAPLPFQAAEATAVWGPFPLRRARLVAGLAYLVLGLLVTAIALMQETLTCAHAGPLAGSCETEMSILVLRKRHRFPIAAIADIRVQITETNNKGHVNRRGQVFLMLAPRPRTLQSESPEAAEEHAAALRRFLADPVAPPVTIATERLLPLLGLGGVFLAIAVAVLATVLAGRRRYRFHFDAPSGQLRVQAEWPFGIAAGPAMVPDLRRPRDVRIRWGEVSDLFTSTRSPGPRGGLIEIVGDDGTTFRPSPRPQPGYGVHVAAAERLRRFLGCPPQSTAEEESVAADLAQARPTLAPTWTGIGGKIAAVWMGASCGVLGGIAIGSILAVTVGGQRGSDPADGPFFYLGALAGITAGVALTWRLTQRPDVR